MADRVNFSKVADGFPNPIAIENQSIEFEGGETSSLHLIVKQEESWQKSEASNFYASNTHRIWQIK